MKIFLGTSKDDVRRILGEPSRIEANFWTYGMSYIQFDDKGSVIAWKNMFHDLDRGFESYLPSNKTFFLGSTQSEVFEALGSPTAIIDSREQEWRYESSHVKFDKNGLVIEWKSVYDQLRHGFVKADADAEAVDLFATKETVLQALGSPDMISALNPDVWQYQASHVKFKDGKVVEWRNQYNQLSHGLRQPVKTNLYLDMGITKEEVLCLLGSPTSLLASNPNVWKYEASHIMFKDDKVVEWKNMFGQLDLACLKATYGSYIDVGLDKLQVLSILGTPSAVSHLNPDVWQYNSSHVKFKDGLVVEWRNMFHDFDRGMKKGDSNAQDIKLGVDEEVVLNRIGSPTSILEREPHVWHYGNASIYFDASHHVTSWKNIHDIKKAIAQFG